jgi:hypothetical protein
VIGSAPVITNTISNCVVIGATANGNGTQGVAIGSASRSGATGVLIGYLAGGSINSSIASNTGVGWAAIGNVSTGSKNTALGYSAGRYVGTGTGTPITTCAGDVFIGYDVRAGANASTNEIIISGYTGSGDGGIGNGSNTTTIGNASTTKTLLYGYIGVGGLTSSDPAIKKSSTTLEIRLADDSAYAPLKCAGFTSDDITLNDAKNIVVNATTGTKIATATTQKLGFWNATPVVQQVLATGASKTVDDVITFLQTIGLCKQS